MEDHADELLEGRYLLHEQLSRGMTATVHAATDRIDQSECVVKLLLEHDTRDPARRALFMQEIASLRALQCDAIVRLLGDGVTTGGAPYFVMEKLVGEDLRRALAREMRLPWTKTCEVLRQICEAMRQVHRAGTLHGDLKPENIFLCDGPVLRVRLLDFGNARPHADSRPNECSGTPEYLAPEWEQRRTHTISGDIYAWGVIAYECITGRLPFRGSDDLDTLRRAREGCPPTFAEIVPWLSPPPALEHLVLRALHPLPERRYSSFEDLAQDLAEAVGTVGNIPMTRHTTRHLHGRSSPRLRKWLLATSALVITASAVFYSLHTPPPASRMKRTTLVWQYGNTGRVKIVLVDGLNPQQIFDLGGDRGHNFQVIGSGDFNADGRNDLLWYNPIKHQAALWNVSLGSNRPARTGSLIAEYGTDGWELVDAGDFDGSGADDLLWQHRSLARAAVCLMVDGIQDACTKLAGPSDDPNWRVRAVADLNRDGNADIIWQHASDQRVTVWSMHGSEISHSTELAGLDSTNWSVAGAGRFVRTDAPGLLLKDKLTGAVAVSIWEAMGAPRVLGTVLPGHDAVAIDDFDADGRDDIVWQTDYTVGPIKTMVWLGREDGRPSTIEFPDVLPHPWHIVTAARF